MEVGGRYVDGGIYTEIHDSLVFYTFESVIESTRSSQFKNQRQANSV